MVVLVTKFNHKLDHDLSLSSTAQAIQDEDPLSPQNRRRLGGIQETSQLLQNVFSTREHGRYSRDGLTDEDIGGWTGYEDTINRAISDDISL
jgi:hypothetical protein